MGGIWLPYLTVVAWPLHDFYSRLYDDKRVNRLTPLLMIGVFLCITAC